MTLRIFKTLWGHQGDLDLAFEECVAFGFDGIEGQAPDTTAGWRDFRQKLDERGLDFIAEVCTAGSYVPRRDATTEEHRQSFAQQVEAALECRPLFITTLAGCDAWSVAQSVEFFGEAHEFARSCGITASFETHRGRSFFNPWT
ncbi:MAG TPA: TIM barrel protein, partial [Abditibacteriaceae bacterium]|nr:TIM barrel protein [Abditibacteriaceae bacterium]